MWMGLLVLKDLGILLDWSSSIEDCCFHVWHILAETSIFVLDLVSKFSSVAHDENRGLASDWLNLLECSEDEDGGFTKTRFSLAENIGTEDSLRNANLLDCRVNRVEVR
jgi:hypothetical protein